MTCKNHVNISDGISIGIQGGFYAYGKQYEAILWLWHFPKLFFHQIICPENPAWQEISRKNYKPYNPNFYREYLQQTITESIQKIKKEIII